jgi:serine/threonine protein phosphatase PrpC
VKLAGDSIILLSSDGLHGVIGEDQIEEILKDSTKTLEEKCGELIEAAHAAGSPDNVTVLLIRRAG